MDICSVDGSIGSSYMVGDDPMLVKAWCKKENGIDASEIRISSVELYRWRCSKCQSIFEATPKSFENKSDVKCLVCSGKKVTADNNLAGQFPEVLDFYAGKKSPATFIARKTKTLKWRCPVCKVLWSGMVETCRKYRGCCPGCRQHLKLPLYLKLSLAEKFPKLAKTYSPDNPIPANEIPWDSKEKVIWVCETGHRTMAEVRSKTQTNSSGGCRVCARVRF